MQNGVLEYCEKEKLIEPGDIILAGVSGGADSVCLLLLLKELQKSVPFSLAVVHVEHGIRGKESQMDALFVEHLCQNLEVPFYCYPVNALELAKQQKIGLEEAARLLRYKCYEQAAECFAKGDEKIKIALAHHADDNAETILFQMVRGSGIDGLCGMQPRRKLKEKVEVIRPMLCVTRKEIEAFLEKMGQPYRIDSTNDDETYSRNKLRKSVLPALTKVNDQAILHINESANYLRELNEYLTQQVEKACKEVWLEKKEGLFLLEKPFLSLPSVIKKEVLHASIVKASGQAKDIGKQHVDHLLALFSLQVGRKWSLPYELCAKRVYEGLLLYREELKREPSFSPKELKREDLLCQKELMWEGFSGTFCFSLTTKEEATERNLKKKYTKYLDYDKMKDSLWIRNRQQKDFLVIDEAGHKKSLKEYFIQEKIPATQRSQIPLIAMGQQILWVIGGRISADFKISEETDKVLKIQLKGEQYDEGESNS